MSMYRYKRFYGNLKGILRLSLYPHKTFAGAISYVTVGSRKIPEHTIAYRDSYIFPGYEGYQLCVTPFIYTGRLKAIPSECSNGRCSFIQLYRRPHSEPVA